MVLYSQGWFERSSAFLIYLIYNAWLIHRILVWDVLGFSYEYMESIIDKSPSFPMLSSNETALTLINSTIDSMYACLLTQLVSEWESSPRQVPRWISSGMRSRLIVMSYVPIVTPHTNLTVQLFWYGCDVFSFDKFTPCRDVEIPSTCGCA